MDAVDLQNMATEPSDDLSKGLPSVPVTSCPAQHDEELSCNIHGIHVFRPGSKDHDLIKTFNFSQDNLILQNEVNAGAISRYLRQVVTRQSNTGLKREISSMGSDLEVLVCLIETQDSSSMARYLSTEFRHFPENIRRHIAGQNAFGGGSWVAPVWHDSERLSYVQNYLIAEEHLKGLESGNPPLSYELGPQNIRCTSLVVWTGGTLQIANRDLPIPVVMIIGEWNSIDVRKMLKHYYAPKNQDRLRRLIVQPEWVFHDLYSNFADWDDIWCAVGLQFDKLYREVYEGLCPSDILSRKGALNSAMWENTMLKELLGPQTRSLKVVSNYARKYAEDMLGSTADGKELLALQFDNRCQELGTSFRYYGFRAEDELEQIKNLLSIMVSVEKISRGQRMERLYYPAIVLQWLLLVATLYGITDFVINPRRFPIPLLAAIASLAILMSKLNFIRRSWEDQKATNKRMAFYRRHAVVLAKHRKRRNRIRLQAAKEEELILTCNDEIS